MNSAGLARGQRELATFQLLQITSILTNNLCLSHYSCRGEAG